MRFVSALSTMLLLTGAAVAQTPNPNALGLWRSDNYATISAFYIQNIPAGTGGYSVWTCLPPDVLTYFRPQSAGPAVRELDFKGIEFFVQIGVNGSNKLHDIPQVEIRKAIASTTVGQEGRYRPVFTPAGLYANFPKQANALNPGTIPTGSVIRYALTSALVTPVAVPAGSAAGDGLCARIVDYSKQYGSSATAPNSVSICLTTTETAVGAGTGSLSGYTLPAGTNGWLDLGGLATHEYTITFYFMQSMIAPVKNNFQLQAGAVINNGGTLPAVLNPGSGFAYSGDDGRGALFPKPLDNISWSINSNATAVLGPSGAGQVWLVPFTMFDGDVGVTGAVDPLPENWIGNASVVQNAYIYPMPLKNWLNDFGTLIGAGPLGTNLNPNDSTLGLWLGLDLTNSLANFTLLLNAFTLSDISAGPSFAGPETKMYDSITNPTGIMARNLAKYGATVGELKSLFNGQTGYTVVTASTNPAYVGLEYQAAFGPALAGRSYYVTCWMLDIASPTNPFGFNIIDMTNVMRITFQP